MQQEIIDVSTAMDNRDIKIRATLDELLKKKGYDSFTDLKNKVLAQLSEKERKKYEQLEKEAKESGKEFETAFGALLLVIGIATTVGGGMSSLSLAHTNINH